MLINIIFIVLKSSYTFIIHIKGSSGALTKMLKDRRTITVTNKIALHDVSLHSHFVVVVPVIPCKVRTACNKKGPSIPQRFGNSPYIIHYISACTWVYYWNSYAIPFDLFLHTSTHILNYRSKLTSIVTSF